MPRRRSSYIESGDGIRESGLGSRCRSPQKIKNVIRLHRGIQAFENCLIHFFDGRKRPTAMADDVGMSQMEISSEPCIWHRLRSKSRVAVAAVSISNGHVENLDTRESEATRYASEQALNDFTSATRTCFRAERIHRSPQEDQKADLKNRRTP